MSGISPALNIAQKWAGASQKVVQAIQGASKATGVSFDYLMDKARQESSFDTNAKAKTSSASGLFQFIDSTWLNAVKTYGNQFGLGAMASKISTDRNGNAYVADPVAKKQILNLRQNPEVASNIVAAMTKDNASFLENSLGGKVGETDLYLAHFLGLSGANKFLKARQDNPLAMAADLFPAAAKANKNVFYNANGTKRSLDQVYGFFADKMGETQGPASTAVVSNDTKNSTSSVINGILTAQGIDNSGADMKYQLPMVIEQAHIDTSTLPAAIRSKLDALQAMNWGQRQALESLVSGMKAFGSEDTSNRFGGKLLSPYTSFVLSKLTTPDEKPADQQQENKIFG